MSEETKDEEFKEERKNRFSSRYGFWICFAGTIILLFESVMDLVLFDIYMETGLITEMGANLWVVMTVISFLLTVFAGILISLMYKKGDGKGYYIAFVVIGVIGLFASSAIYSIIFIIVGGTIGIIYFTESNS